MAQLTPAEVKQAVEEQEYVTGVVTLYLLDIVAHDQEWKNDELSCQLVGNDLLMDISWQIAADCRPAKCVES